MTSKTPPTGGIDAKITPHRYKHPCKGAFFRTRESHFVGGRYILRRSTKNPPIICKGKMHGNKFCDERAEVEADTKEGESAIEDNDATKSRPSG